VGRCGVPAAEVGADGCGMPDCDCGWAIQLAERKGLAAPVPRGGTEDGRGMEVGG
jgi:hypothetical protein